MSELMPGRLVLSQDEHGKYFHDLDGVRLNRLDALEVLLPGRRWLRPLLYDWQQPAEDAEYDPKLPPVYLLPLGGLWEDLARQGRDYERPMATLVLPEDALLRPARLRGVRERTEERLERISARRPLWKKP